MQRFGVRVRLGGELDFERTARQTAYEQTQHVACVLERDGFLRVERRLHERIDVVELRAAAIQTLAVERIHRVDDPRLRSRRVDASQHVGRECGEPVGELAAGARNDGNPVQREILEVAAERRQFRRQRLGSAPRRQHRVERFVQPLFELRGRQPRALRARGRRVRRASWRAH